MDVGGNSKWGVSRKCSEFAHQRSPGRAPPWPTAIEPADYGRRNGDDELAMTSSERNLAKREERSTGCFMQVDLLN